MIDRGDIDIDFSNRDKALEYLQYIPASIIKDGKITKHNTGVYFHAVPVDPITNQCSWDYEYAEHMNMYKIDMLNVSVYDTIRDEQHLLDLMEKPLNWSLFENPKFVAKLFHLGHYGDLTSKLKPKSIEHIAMILALIRPGKKHLQTRCINRGFDSIKEDIWTSEPGDAYVFRKSHAFSYAVLVGVHANLILENSA